MIKGILFIILFITILSQDQGPIDHAEPNIPQFDFYLMMYPQKQYTPEQYNLRKSIYVTKTDKWRQLTFNYPQVNRYTDWTREQIQQKLIVKMTIDDNIVSTQYSHLTQQLTPPPLKKVWTLVPGFPNFEQVLDIGCKPDWGIITTNLLEAAQFCIANKTVQLSAGYMIYCSIDATTRAGFATTPGQTQAQAAFNFLFDHVCLNDTFNQNDTFRTIDQALTFGLAGVPLNSQFPYDGNINGLADITQLGPVPSCDLANYPSNVMVNGVFNRQNNRTYMQMKSLLAKSPVISTFNLIDTIDYYGSGGFGLCTPLSVSDTFVIVVGYTTIRAGSLKYPIYIVKPTLDDSNNNNAGYINIFVDQSRDCNIGDLVYYISQKTSALTVQSSGQRVFVGLVIALILALVY